MKDAGSLKVFSKLVRVFIESVTLDIDLVICFFNTGLLIWRMIIFDALADGDNIFNFDLFPPLITNAFDFR